MSIEFSLEARCNFASGFWWSVVSSLTAIAYRHGGERDLNRIWFKTLRGEQADRFEEGLRKLGIEADEPPAVKAAKYHFYSNSVGGLNMQYIRESDRKVWIRYIGPNGTYPGLAMLCMPASQRRTIFSSWHPMNAVYLNCPRLGYVATKFTSEGDPYDEGYFYEYDHELREDERIQFEVAHKTPEFDPAKAPKFDPANWPEERLLKGMRNFPRDYVGKVINVMDSMYGEQTTNFIVSKAMRCMAVQMTGAFKAQLEVSGTGLASVAEFHTRLLHCCFEEFETTRRSGDEVEITRSSFAPFSPDDISEHRRDSFFEFQAMATRVMNGHVSARRETSSTSNTETWTLTDRKKWLW